MRSVRLFMAFIVIVCFLTSCNSKNHQITGYAEGTYRYISSNYSGILKQVPVNRGDEVKTGQLLFTLDPQPESDQLNQAKAQLAQAQAQVEQSRATVILAKLTWQRQFALLRTKAASQDAADQARTQLDQAIAQQDQANQNLLAIQAALAQAEWVIKQKTVTAPVAALVYDVYFSPGELVPAGQAVVSLLAPQDIYAVSYVNGDELGLLHIGQEMILHCNNCKSTVKAKISFISPQAEYAPPILYSDRERSKLVFRIEITPNSLTDAIKLHPGQPLDIQFQ